MFGLWDELEPWVWGKRAFPTASPYNFDGLHQHATCKENSLKNDNVFWKKIRKRRKLIFNLYSYYIGLEELGRACTEKWFTSANGMGGKDGRIEGGRKTKNEVTWLDDIRATDGGTYEDLKKLALDRRRWRTWDFGHVWGHGISDMSEDMGSRTCLRTDLPEKNYYSVL